MAGTHIDEARQTTLMTGIGTVFSVKKTVLQSDIKAAGMDLTLPSVGGDLELIGVYIQNGAIPFTSATHTAVANMYTNNVSGSVNFLEMNEAEGIANCIFNHYVAITLNLPAVVVLESGKKVSINATGENFTSAGYADIYLIFRRLESGATIVAA
jgi:hypothetical protein